MITKSLLMIVWSALAVIVPGPGSAASVILDTAAPPTDTSGARIRDDSWVFHRFEITATTRIENIGGDFTSFTGAPVDIFGAIVHLNSSFDTPNSIDLSSADLLATTLIGVGTTRNLYTSPLDLTLSPGWYALEFGSGRFAADSVTANRGVMMQSFDTDLSPGQFQTAVFQASNGLGPNFVTQAGITSRFYITGTVVPLPAAAWLFVSGLFGLVALARRQSLRRR